MYMPERYQLEFHPEYSRLDRRALIEVFIEHFPGFAESRVQEMTRHQLISLILEQEECTAREQDGGTASEPVAPLLRRSRKSFELPKSMASGQGMYYRWENEEAVVDAAVSLAKGDDGTREWNLGSEVPEGSLLLTVLGCTPPLVTALESVMTVTEQEVYVEQIAVFADPISLYDLESMIGSGLPRSSKALSLLTAKRVLKSLARAVKDPKPLIVKAGHCVDGVGPNSNAAIHVLTMLQRDYDEIPLCDGCGRDVDAETSVHFFRPFGVDPAWDIQDHVDDAGLLCADCHELVHGPTKTRLSQIVSAPPCPECGEGRPRKAFWGMPSGNLGDEYVLMGCAIPPTPRAEWICRSCDTPYAVVAHPENPTTSHWINPTPLFEQ